MSFHCHLGSVCRIFVVFVMFENFSISIFNMFVLQNITKILSEAHYSFLIVIIILYILRSYQKFYVLIKVLEIPSLSDGGSGRSWLVEIPGECTSVLFFISWVLLLRFKGCSFLGEFFSQCSILVNVVWEIMGFLMSRGTVSNFIQLWFWSFRQITCVNHSCPSVLICFFHLSVVTFITLIHLLFNISQILTQEITHRYYRLILFRFVCNLSFNKLKRLLIFILFLRRAFNLLNLNNTWPLNINFILNFYLQTISWVMLWNLWLSHINLSFRLRFAQDWLDYHTVFTSGFVEHLLDIFASEMVVFFETFSVSVQVFSRRVDVILVWLRLCGLNTDFDCRRWL